MERGPVHLTKCMIYMVKDVTETGDAGKKNLLIKAENLFNITLIGKFLKKTETTTSEARSRGGSRDINRKMNHVFLQPRKSSSGSSGHRRGYGESINMG